MSPELAEVLRRVATEGATLKAGERLRREFPAEVVASAMAQHELRQQAATKFTRADEMLFTRDGLEQASGERIARHRAARFASANRVADLCTGIGGDLIALAQHVEAVAVDRDPLHLELAQHNAGVYGVADRVRPILADVREVDLNGCDGVFVDPARRLGGHRLRPGESEPPLGWCLALEREVGQVGIKAAPGLDHAVVPPGWELEFIAEGRDLKEAALWSPALATTQRRATVLPEGHTLASVDGPPIAVREPGAYLLDPNPAVTRAGLVEELARRLDAWKIDDRIAFLCVDDKVSTPFARTLHIVASLPWQEKAITARLRTLDVGAVDIRRRGLAGDVEAIGRRLMPRGAAGARGSRKATLVMTRVADRPWALICLDTPDLPTRRDPGTP